YTTQPVERSHVPTRDRLRGGRGLRTVRTGQRFLESFEAFHALRRGTVKLRPLVPGYRPTRASAHETARAIVMAVEVLGAQLKKAAWGCGRPSARIAPLVSPYLAAGPTKFRKVC